MIMSVVNIRKSSYNVYIGRGSIWGNPFVIGIDGNRGVVIDKYRDYMIKRLESGSIAIERLLELDGKVLGCYCAPLPCHGNVLLELIEKEKRCMT